MKKQKADKTKYSMILHSFIKKPHFKNKIFHCLPNDLSIIENTILDLKLIFEDSDNLSSSFFPITSIRDSRSGSVGKDSGSL